MFCKKISTPTAGLILFAFFIGGCVRSHTETVEPSPPTVSEAAPSKLTATIIPTAAVSEPASALDLSNYAFPAAIDPAEQYLFYVHGKIIEDQGIPAISPEFGEYEYQAILKKFSNYGFVVISEQREKNTDGLEYAKKVVEQLTALLNAGVPAKNITVVGASKGAGIAVYVSNLLKNEEINYVLLAICSPGTVEEFKQSQVTLYGNILSIYDSKDELAGSCQEFFAFSQGKGISRQKEIVLNIGMGHGILYKPLDEWMVPAGDWTGEP